MQDKRENRNEVPLNWWVGQELLLELSDEYINLMQPSSDHDHATHRAVGSGGYFYDNDDDL